MDGTLTVLGDLHGKCHALESILAERDVEARLAAGTHTLVSVGDLVDRGPRHQESGHWIHDGVERLLDRMIELSARYPGRVHVVCGNHEMAHLIDIADRRLGPTDASEWPGQGRVRLTPERLAFLEALPVALRLSLGDRRALVVHAGVPAVPFTLDAAGQADGPAQAHALAGVRALVWSNPVWSVRAAVTPMVYTERHVVEFLTRHDAHALIRGHRNEMEIRPIGDAHTYICVHSAQGDERQDSPRDGFAFLAWDPPEGPRLVVRRGGEQAGGESRRGQRSR